MSYIQAAIGSKIIARESVRLCICFSQMLWSGYYSKKTIRETERRGKKRMKQIGQIEVPKDAFMTY